MSRKTMNKRHLSLLAICMGVFLGSGVLYHFHLLDSWQNKLLDRFFVTEQPDSSIIIIAIDDESLGKIGQWPWPREVFARALPHLAGAQALGVDISFSEPSRYGEDDDALLSASLSTLSKTTVVVLPVQFSERGDLSSIPLSIFTTGPQTGFVNIPLDRDGVARSAVSTQGGSPSFASNLSLRTHPAPSNYRIHYYGRAGTFTTLPFSDVYSGAIPESTFTGKTVLLGVTATDLHDFVETPFGAMPGVEAHANSIETLRTSTYPREIPPFASFALLLLAVLGAALVVLYIQKLLTLLLFLSSLVLVLNALALALFSYSLVLPILYVNIAFLASAGLSIAFQYMTESDEKKRIRNAFQYYLTPHVIDELLKHPEKLTLGGEKRKMTILFSDIAGFTSISERLSPPELTTLMNEYLTAMTHVIERHGGVVDKYIGDAIMAFWGAPLEDAEQALHACTSGIEMTSALANLNKEWSARHIPPITARIGIATGDVVVGNMGSESRFNYTVMGDTVNFASRLEAINKAYGTTCIVSEQTTTDTPSLVFREIDVVRVKGKKEAKKIFELIEQEPSVSRVKQFELFVQGYTSYQDGSWGEAVSLFTQVLALGDDGPASVLLERAVLYRTSPPPAWDGVYTFDTK